MPNQPHPQPLPPANPRDHSTMRCEPRPRQFPRTSIVVFSRFSSRTNTSLWRSICFYLFFPLRSKKNPTRHAHMSSPGRIRKRMPYHLVRRLSQSADC